MPRKETGTSATFNFYFPEKAELDEIREHVESKQKSLGLDEVGGPKITSAWMRRVLRAAVRYEKETGGLSAAARLEESFT